MKKAKSSKRKVLKSGWQVKKKKRNLHMLGINSVGVGYGHWATMGAMVLENLKQPVKDKIKESDKDPKAVQTEILFLHSKDVQKMIVGLSKVRDEMIKRETLNPAMQGLLVDLTSELRKASKDDKKRTSKTQSNKR